MELAMLFISSEPSPKAPLIVSSRSTSALAIIADKHPSMAVPVITILNRLGDSIEQILHDDASPCIRAVLHSLASLHHFALLSSSVDYIGIVAQLSFFAPNVAIPRATTLHTTEAALAVATLDRISSFARPGQISISELWPLTALFYYADVPASATVTVYRVLQRFIELVDARDADPSSHAFQNALLSLARSSSSSSSTSIPGKVALLHIWTLTPLPSTAALATGADFVVEELRDGATSPGYVDAVARVAGRLGAALAAAQHVKALVRVAFDEERSRDVRLVAARVLQGVAGASPNVLIDSAFLDAVMDTDWAPFDNRHDPEWRSVTLGVAGSVVRAAGPEANLPNGPRLTAVLLSSLAKAANVAVMRVVDALLDSSVYLAAVSAPTGPFYSQQAVLGVLVQIGKRTDDDGISLGVAIADRLIRDDVTLEDLIAGPNGVRVIAEICRICSKVAVGDRIARPAASSLTMSALVHRALVFADRVGKVQDVVDGDDNVMMTAFYGALIENVTRLARKAALAPVDATHWATVISQTAALWVLSKATTVRPDADIAGMIRVALSLSGGGRTDLPAIASALIADIKDGGLIADSRDLLATITQVLPDASVADDDSLVLLCIGLGRMAVSSATRMAMIRTRTVPVLIRLLNPQQREGDARRPAHHRAISDLMRVLNPVQGELAHATDQVATRAWYARTGLLSMSTRKSGFLVGPPHAEPVDAMTSVGHCRDLLTRSGNASATALDRRDDDCRLSMQDWIDAEYDLLLEEGRPPPP
ncbi:hypothetical protein PBRA_006035 [Plasmodiophora brassicae]|nr:hypothetical protein PBRA_006035 [Plasmodiophora brassicae]